MRVRQHKANVLLFVAMMVIVVAFMPVTIKAQEESSSTTVQFNGHIFNLPDSIANGITAFIIDEPTEQPGGDAFQPPRTEIRLIPYTREAAPPAVGWVNVYAIGDLEGNPAYEQYEQLRGLLSERPDLNIEETLPTLYPYQQSALAPDQYSEVLINAAYLDSVGYRGITYLYGRVIQLGDSAPLMLYRLYFEGISSDDQRYLSAQVEGQQELLESLEGIHDRDEYINQVRTLFEEPTDEAVLAWLNQANLLFSSFDYAA